MDSPVNTAKIESSRSLTPLLIWTGMVAVAGSFLWLVIHINQTISEFGEILAESDAMDEVSNALSKTFQNLNEFPIGVYVIGSVGFILIVAGFAIFLLNRTKGKNRG